GNLRAQIELESIMEEKEKVEKAVVSSSTFKSRGTGHSKLIISSLENLDLFSPSSKVGQYIYSLGHIDRQHTIGIDHMQMPEPFLFSSFDLKSSLKKYSTKTSIEPKVYAISQGEI